MLGMMVCNHLTFKTGISHKLGNFLHIVQNCHIYDRHIPTAKEILNREPTKLQPKIKLICKPKDFYEHTADDFLFTDLEGILKLETKLELAI
jgi:thymidylate synthase